MIKLEASSESEHSDVATKINHPSERLYRHCAGRRKTSNRPCGAIITKSLPLAAKFLPTCSDHSDQQIPAGWCQYRRPHGQTCGHLFRWTPPYLELCPEHSDHPDTPCYFLSLPLELRHEIFSYLLPTRPIGSSTTMSQAHSVNHTEEDRDAWSHNKRDGAGMVLYDSVFPTPFVHLVLVNRQISHEVQHIFYSTAVFTVDVRRDGTFMCGRRLLEPKQADGSAHCFDHEATDAMRRFLINFNWAAVKNYNVDILLENWSCSKTRPNTLPPDHNRGGWDEEVELYDMRGKLTLLKPACPTN